LPYRSVSSRLDGGEWKGVLFRLQLLKADDVRLTFSHPDKQVGEALVDVVDVKGGDPHAERGLNPA
jgi:hypothetical protein